MSLHAPKQNRILAALAQREHERLLRNLELVEFLQGQVLYREGGTIRHLYFPTTLAVSVLASSHEGGATSLATIGHEGFVGFSAVVGHDVSPFEVVALSDGHAYRLPREVAAWEFGQHGSFAGVVMDYLQTILFHFAYSALCIQAYTVEQRLCRWLLEVIDRVPEQPLKMTQAFIANNLGVRREAITEAALKLQAAGLIEYSRGTIVVTDRGGLENLACECYGRMRAECSRELQAALPTDTVRHARLGLNEIRHLAEERFRNGERVEPQSLSHMGRLLDELQIRQIELKIQNDEISAAYAEADRLQKKYADIYDFAPVAYVTVDGQGIIRQTNLAAAIQLGLKRSEIGGYRFGASVAAASQASFARFLEETLAGRKRLQLEVDLVPTVQRPEATVIIDGIADENGSECLMVITDITDRKRAEQQFLQQRDELEKIIAARTAELVHAWQVAEAARQAKTTFLANMSHEVRTPLHVIYGMSTLIRREGLSPKQLARLDELDRASVQLTTIMDEILELTAIESGKFSMKQEAVDFRALVDQVVERVTPQLQTKPLEFREELAVLPAVRGDMHRLNQALFNYVANAIKFTPGGHITLRIFPVEDAGDRVVLRFEVEDTGIGIAPEILPRLFAPFEQADNSMTRAYGGIGLGLVITRKIAQLMGGDAGCESVPGTGSTFWFTVRLEKG